jgi:transcriptional regulator with XRE-family HTH domain
MQSIPETYSRKQVILENDGLIGAALSMIREQQGLRQDEVASRLGCGQPLISKIEAGQRSLKFAEIDLFAAALEVSREHFVSTVLDAMSGETPPPRAANDTSSSHVHAE